MIIIPLAIAALGVPLSPMPVCPHENAILDYARSKALLQKEWIYSPAHKHLVRKRI